MRYEIRELGIGGILDQAITLVKNHFGLLLMINLVLFIPTQFILGWATVRYTQGMFAEVARARELGVEPDPQAALSFLLIFLPITFLAYIVTIPLTTAATTHALASEYLERPTSVKSSFGRALRVFFPLILTNIITMVPIYLGYYCCCVPGVFLNLIWIFTTQVVVIEGTWGIGAMKRSYELIKGSFLVGFALLVILFLVQLGLGIIGQFATIAPLFASVISTLVQTATNLLLGAAWVVFYFSCRCKNEGFDLAMLAEAVGRD